MQMCMQRFRQAAQRYTCAGMQASTVVHLAAEAASFRNIVAEALLSCYECTCTILMGQPSVLRV